MEKVFVKNNEKEKCLYECESIINAYEYKKMAKYFPSIYWSYVINGTFFNLIFSAVIAILFENLIVTLTFL